MAPDPKPAKRVKATAAEWEKLRRAKLGPCRVCGDRRTTLHHIVPKSLGGDDLAANLVSLCGDGTRGCHGLVEARDPKTCAALRERLAPSEILYVFDQRGEDFLARYYPLSSGGPANESKETAQSAA